jgi:uncharacterized protein YeeX (DUF496 family)
MKGKKMRSKYARWMIVVVFLSVAVGFSACGRQNKTQRLITDIRDASLSNEKRIAAIETLKEKSKKEESVPALVELLQDM